MNWFKNDDLRIALQELSKRLDAVESSPTSPDVAILRRLEALEGRFADLHARLTEVGHTGKERLSSAGRRAKDQFMFGGPSPGWVPPP